MPSVCPRGRRCAAGTAPGGCRTTPFAGPLPGDAHPSPPVPGHRHRCRPGGPGVPSQSRAAANGCSRARVLAEWQVTTKKNVTPEWQVTPDEQNFQGSAGVFPHSDALARSCGQEHNHSQSWQSTNPLEGAELSPVCSPALGPGEASTSCSNLPTCYAPPGVLSHLPLTGEMKGSPSSQGAWLQVKERILHNPDSVSELQARETWLSTWLSLHARYFPLRTKQAC